MQAQTIQEPNKKMKEWSDEEFNQWFYHFINKTAIDNALQKPTAGEDRKISNHNGNKIETLFSNFGSICLPRQAPALVWPTGSGRSYGYEFAPIVAAEVIGKNEEVLHIVTDALVDGGERANPNLSTGNVMGWEPLPGYSREGQPDIAMSDKPDSWPESWGGKWNGLFGKGIITADQESFWVMDDRFNDEFDYYPLTSGADSIRGLGIRMTCRGYQYAAGPAEDIILFIYDLELRKDVKPLDKVFVAMLGDAHIGGGANFSDDYAAFNEDINLLYTWDKPNSTNDYGLEKMGYLGFAFIASPGNATNSIDDDDDGFIDESQYDEIDNDGDWHATDEEAELDLKEEDTSNGIDDDGDGRIDDFGDADKKSDDVGADGVPNTGDYGEGDGVPTAGEPDFDETDFDEIDEIGVTSFDAPIYGDFSGSQDEVIWNKIQPGTFGTPVNDADNVFIFGCGPFALQPGEKMRYVIMVSVGEDYEDLLNNTNKSYEILSRSFSFTKAPDPPNVTVIPGDKKVTLYWDDIAEKSVDPLLGSDF
ncbi:MAG: hypothetical protein K8R74_09845, partial [Bacteroidales bacterium]|nr:hypothetical protein [Bacteroidales bacterium]